MHRFPKNDSCTVSYHVCDKVVAVNVCALLYAYMMAQLAPDGTFGQLGPDTSSKIVLPSGVQIINKRPGDGKCFPLKGQLCRLHYTVRVVGGNIFDTTHQRGPANMRIGTGQVLSGLDEALQKMSFGEVSLVVVPPNRGFGPRGYPPLVPPNVALEYEVELIAIEGQ